jgi:hypothetical protein
MFGFMKKLTAGEQAWVTLMCFIAFVLGILAAQVGPALAR